MQLTYLDSEGGTRLKAIALPLVVSAICVPIVAAFLLGGAAAGLAAGAVAALVILFLAARNTPLGAMEVASAPDEHRRLLVLATRELDTPAAERIAERAAGAADVRIVVPKPSRGIDRWLSAEDAAREQAQGRLARAAGTLTAAGLPVSGSIGDSDTTQAVEDELHSFAADEIVVVPEAGSEPGIEKLRGRLALPLTTVRPPS